MSAQGATPALFTSIKLNDLMINHRLWVAPMCQFSAMDDGLPTDWHLVHLGSFAVGRAAMIVAEATAVHPVGRISPQDTGIWHEEHVAAWQRITQFVQANNSKIALQLSHAGRKASMGSRFERSGVIPEAEGGWQTVGPSETAYGDHPPARSLSILEIKEVIQDFGKAAERAVRAGFDAIEVHAAHGYLIHSFLSPISNVRDDEYGGSFEHRSKLAVEIITEVRAAIPPDMPLMVRLSATDWIEGGWTLEDTKKLVKILEPLGVDFFSISSGGNDPSQKITVGPGYQVSFARAIKAETSVPIGVAGLIDCPKQAETLLVDGAADVIFMGREFLRDPKFALTAANDLGGYLEWPRPHVAAKYASSVP